MATALDRAIALVTDGEEVDWATLRASAASDAEREALRQLECLAIDVAEKSASFEQIRFAASPAHPGIWGHLRVLEELGRGASGVVFRAWDTKLEREVALKLLHHGSRDATFQEAQRLAGISHPSIVIIYGVDQNDGRMGLWMEMLRGETLDAMLRARGPFSAREAAGIARDLCGAVAAVHGAGLVHRDIKAQNVMRQPGGRLVLMDLGASDLIAPDATRVRSLAGTPLYMAPELLEKGHASIASDIYALGVLLYRLVTNAYPVEGYTVGDVRRAHAERRLRPLREARPGLPGAYVAIVERCLTTVPAQRYQSVSELERGLTFSEVGIGRRVPPRPLTVILGLLLAALLGSAGTWVLLRNPVPTAQHVAGLSPDQYALFAGYEDLAFERLSTEPAAAASTLRSAMEVMRPALPGLSPEFVLLFLRLAEAERRAGNLPAARAALLDAHAHAVSVLDGTDPVRILIAAEEARLAAASGDHIGRARAMTAATRLRAMAFDNGISASAADDPGEEFNPSAFLTFAAHRSHDPAALGWQSHARFPAAGSPVGSGQTSSWRLEAQESMAFHFQRIAPAISRRAMHRGFSIFARVEPEHGLANVVFDSAPAGPRFDLLLLRTENGQLDVRAATGIVPRTGPGALVPSSHAGEASIIELRFDPTAGWATVYVNGALVHDRYLGHTQFQDSQAGTLSWGVVRDDASETSRPSARFKLVWLEVR